MIKIICDSMSDLPKSFAQENNLDIVPTSVTIDCKEYKDGIDVTAEEFFSIIRKSKDIPKTSQATYSRFIEVFERHAPYCKDIIYIGGSSKASGSYQSGVMAINDIKDNYNCNFHHIDTLNFSAGGTLFVIKACLLLKEGKSAKEIVNELESLKGTQKVYLSADDLSYMKKGGRISATKATIGTILNIKPLIALEDGVPVLKGQCRGKKQVSVEIFKKSTENIESFKDKIIVFGCGDNEDDLKTLKDLIEKTNCPHIYEVKPGPTMTAHTGPSIIGMAIF